MWYGLKVDGNLLLVHWFPYEPTPSDFGLDRGKVVEVTVVVGRHLEQQ
jgi:hypothetical protein